MLETSDDNRCAALSTARPPRRVLVIDDSALVREAVSVGLAIAGWTVLQAGSGEQGIPLAEEAKPDAILLDVEMPVMDGIAVVERLQAASVTDASPVVLLTAHAGPQHRARFADLGAAGLIAKPFEVATLADEV